MKVKSIQFLTGSPILHRTYPLGKRIVVGQNPYVTALTYDSKTKEVLIETKTGDFYIVDAAGLAIEADFSEAPKATRKKKVSNSVE